MTSITKAIFLSFMCFWILRVRIGNACPSNCSCIQDESVHCCLSQISDRFQIPEGVLGPRWKSIKIQGLQLGAVDSNTFAGRINNAESLDLQYNAITTIKADTFEGLTKLKTIDLSFNFLKELPEHLFRTNNGLKTLLVKGNHLCEISKDIMPQFQQLKLLDVSGNQIIKWDMDICDNFDDSYEIRAFGNQFEDLQLDIFCPLKNKNIDQVIKVLDFNSNGLTNLTLKKECPDPTYNDAKGPYVDITLFLEGSKLKSIEHVSLMKIQMCPLWKSASHDVVGIMRVSMIKSCFCNGTNAHSFGDFSYSVNTDSQADETARCGRDTKACKREERQCEDSPNFPFLDSDSDGPICSQPPPTEPPGGWIMWIAIGAGGFIILLIIVITIVSCCCCKCCQGCKATCRKPRGDFYEDYDPNRPGSNSSTSTNSTNASSQVAIIPEIRQKKKKANRKKARMPSPPFSGPQRKPALSPKAIETYDIPPPAIEVENKPPPLPLKQTQLTEYAVPPPPQPIPIFGKAARKKKPENVSHGTQHSQLNPVTSHPRQPKPRIPTPSSSLRPPVSPRGPATRPVPLRPPPVAGSSGPGDVYTEISNRSDRGYDTMTGGASSDQYGKIYDFGDDSFYGHSDDDEKDYDNAPDRKDVYEDALPKRSS